MAGNMKLRALLLAGLCVAVSPVHAGLFDDEGARQQILELEGRISDLEAAGKQQAEAGKQLLEADKQQTRSVLDLQSQIEAQNRELRNLRGQNEELVHNLRDAEKRQRDFYIDLDARVRHFESIESAVPPATAPAAATASTPPAAAAPVLPPQHEKATNAEAVDSLAVENRAYEAAYGMFKSGKHLNALGSFQDFLKKYPESVHVPNVHYGMGSAYSALKDCKNALASYQLLASKYAYSPKLPDTLLGIAGCQAELKDVNAAEKTLRQIIAKYPGSETAAEAKKRLATLK
jgi:tol-pal system protein YbgF